MAKGKAGGGVQNRAIYSRISFLQQAAVALSSARRGSLDSGVANANTPGASSTTIEESSGAGSGTALEGMSRRLATDLRAVSLKTRIRLKPAVKQTICKFCDSILIDGESCTSTIENRSKGAKKSWADVLVRKCHTCERERRYPVSAARPKRKTERRPDGGGGHLHKQAQKG
ncbi:RNAse P Rpr2/Rpp21/SNM1 subunit domain-containing protein [Chaetomidium leptoderma]|uniref:RNAse P Rpr2/Rpp21/SNM1 subunit domain-containing protein n=1 Tax=Chaetomidium leptoderma TaxID=669021 RepID=A0AAN6VNY6_9PEZI|nr:RNAse P Rpr2/Rpp21/SNM1 subunit domain-containing protein [Chaetomidium leptoderma]